MTFPRAASIPIVLSFLLAAACTTPDPSTEDSSSDAGTAADALADALGARDASTADAGPPPIDVRAEGAIGDGKADDAQAIESALAKGVALGRAIVFPAGRYLLARTVHVSVAAGRSLDASGQGGATIVGAATEPTDETGLIDIVGAGDTQASAVHLAHLTIELSSITRGQLDGLQIHGGLSRVELDDVAATGASRWGVAIVSARSGAVSTCRAENNRYGGLGLNAVANLTVTGGVYSNNGTVAPTDGYGVSCMSSLIGPCTGVTISGVRADLNKRKGIDIHSGHDIVIDANTVSGFQSSGIYAVNEDTGKDVRDVTITNNVVDGTGAQFYVYGVEVGAFSAAATPSGTFTVRGNTIKNTSFTTSSAIMIRNPTSPAIGPVRVVVEKNIVQNGAAPDAYVVRGDNYDAPVGTIVVKDNTLSAASAAVGIGLLRASTAEVSGNTIAIAGGSVAYGILVSAPATASIANNLLGGGASYTTPIAASAGQVLRTNTLNGSPLPDAN
jgi:hypothetical protein